MANTHDLPCELVAAVLSSLESLEDLVNAICACRHFYTSFREHPSVAGNIVLSFFSPDALPLAVAAELVSTLPAPRTADAVRHFVDVLANDERRLRAQVRCMPLQALYSMLDTEDAITDLAFDFAERAWEQFYFHRPRDVGLSIAEAFRFFRAFYRTEIFFRAFPQPQGKSTEDDVREVVYQSSMWLLTSFAQFEIEQIACVHDYLERKLLLLCLRVFFEDVELGSKNIDFLTLGENPQKQQWISQGAYFMARLMRGNMNDRSILLRNTMDKPWTDLFRALVNVGTVYFDHKTEAQTQPRDRRDPDSGPPSAFDFANVDLLMGEAEEAAEEGEVTPPLSTMMEDDAGLRERAYVLWDMERMKNWDLWAQIDMCPSESTNTPTREQLAVQRTLWRARTGVWSCGSAERRFVRLTDDEEEKLKDIFEPWGDEALGEDAGHVYS